MLRVWATLTQEATLDGAIARGTKMGFLKLLTASGNTAGAGGRRRSSAASGALGRFVFAHLRILGNVLDLLLRDATATRGSCTRPAPGRWRAWWTPCSSRSTASRRAPSRTHGQGTESFARWR